MITSSDSLQQRLLVIAVSTARKRGGRPATQRDIEHRYRWAHCTKWDHLRVGEGSPRYPGRTSNDKPDDSQHDPQYVAENRSSRLVPRRESSPAKRLLVFMEIR